jgi:hypothetical protein
LGVLSRWYSTSHFPCGIRQTVGSWRQTRRD